MTRFLPLLLSMALSVARPLSAQPNPNEKLRTAGELCLDGYFEAAIELARPILDSTALSQTERGRGWIVVGSAYQNEGDIQEAMTAYENALRVLGKQDDNLSDYGSALSSLGTLLRDMKQFGGATQVELRALHVERQVGDHERIATICAILADLELGLKHTKSAQTWLNKATEESRLAPSLGEDFYAATASTQASLEETKGHLPAAIAGYEKEIDYLARAHGEKNAQVGWACMLLGKAYLKNGNVSDALNSMRRGRALLLQTAGANNLRYLAAQIEYAHALRSAGMKAEAARTKAEAESELRSLFEEQCSQCRITALALH